MKKLHTIKIIACLSTILVMPIYATKRNPNDGCWRKFCNAFNSCLRQTTRAVAISAFIIPGAASSSSHDSTIASFNSTLGDAACQRFQNLQETLDQMNSQDWMLHRDPPHGAVQAGLFACERRAAMLKKIQKNDEEMTQLLTGIQDSIDAVKYPDRSK